MLTFLSHHFSDKVFTLLCYFGMEFSTQEQFFSSDSSIHEYIPFLGIKPDENGMYTIGDVMFTAEEILWLYGTGDDIERNGHPSSMARWPGSWNSEYMLTVCAPLHCIAGRS